MPVSPVILQGPNRGQRVLKQRISFLGSSHTSCYLHRPLPALAATAHVVAATESKFSLSGCWAAVGGNRQIIPCHTTLLFLLANVQQATPKAFIPSPISLLFTPEVYLTDYLTCTSSRRCCSPPSPSCAALCAFVLGQGGALFPVRSCLPPTSLCRCTEDICTP